MAQLGAQSEAGAGPSAAMQLSAVAWVRWRWFANSFRRKGGKSELVARIFMIPLYALLAIGPIVGTGAAGYLLVKHHTLGRLWILTWAVFASWTFLISARAVAPQEIDLSLLLRFPIRLRAYLMTRFMFGLLAPPNIVGTIALASATIGIGVAAPRLFPWAAMVFACYAFFMLLLLRVGLLWLDRFLAQRRTREIVGVLFALVFVSFQFLNIEFQTRMRTGHLSPTMMRLEALRPALHVLHPVFAVLPPSLAATAVVKMNAGHTLAAVAALGGLLGFTAVVLWLFAYRLRAEFRGENFNEAPRREAPGQQHEAERAEGKIAGGLAALSPAIAACVEKEVRYIVRGPSMVLTILTPLVLVGLYANRLGQSEYVLPLALAYTLVVMLPLLYNTLGPDAAGMQLYLLSPTPLRSVFLAKNLVNCVLIGLVSAVATVLAVWNHRPRAEVAVATAFWFVAMLFINLSLGNSRSLYAPVKVDIGRIQRKQANSQFSMLVVLLTIAVSGGVGYLFLWGEHRIGFAWIAPWPLLALAIGGFWLYARTLARIGRVTLSRRENLLEALCKE